MKIRRNEAASAPPSACFELVTEGAAGSVAAFRVELSDRTVSFARGDLRRWTLVKADPQRLLILIGHDLVVTIVGRGLSNLHEALDRDRLLTVRCSADHTGSGPSIKSIELVERPASEPKESR